VSKVQPIQPFQSEPIQGSSRRLILKFLRPKASWLLRPVKAKSVAVTAEYFPSMVIASNVSYMVPLPELLHQRVVVRHCDARSLPAVHNRLHSDNTTLIHQRPPIFTLVWRCGWRRRWCRTVTNSRSTGFVGENLLPPFRNDLSGQVTAHSAEYICAALCTFFRIQD
jgi:hypothetical protein